MAIETDNTLVESIRELDLFDPARMDRLGRDLAERFPQPRDLGRELIKREWLTAFQVNQLMLGRGALLVLGPYVLLERLGVGGMGEVFKARHRKLDRIAALKVISRQHLSHSAALQRFLREAEAAAQLNHPNIVAVHDAGEQGDRHYLAMEYIDGIDLGRLLAEAGPLPVALACDFIRQAALGLHHAHEMGFVHRDIKPANLLVSPRGGLGRAAPVELDRLHGATVKILDMGLVRLHPARIEDNELALTQKGVVLGTMDYLAPEQARNSHHVDRRADLYSLGCTLYHLLAGQPPFAGGMALDKLLRHQTEQPASLAQLRPDVPRSMLAVINRLLAKRPEDRFQAADAAALALIRLAETEPATAVFEAAAPRSRADDLTPTRIIDSDGLQVVAEADGTLPEVLPCPSSRTRPVPRSKSGKRRLRWLVVALLALGLIVGLAGWLLIRPSPPARKKPDAPARSGQARSASEGTVSPTRQRGICTSPKPAKPQAAERHHPPARQRYRTVRATRKPMKLASFAGG